MNLTNLHIAILVLLYMLTDNTPVYGACTSNVPELNGLNLRSINNSVTGDGHHIKDGELAEGWYSAVSSAGKQYRMSSRQRDGLPDLSQCGTRNPIYLNESVPDLLETKEISVKACYATWDDACATTLAIKVRLCSGRPQYYLPAPQGISGYCFEPEDNQPAPSYVPPKPTVVPGMSYMNVFNPGKQIYNHVPQLEFTCEFLQDSRWYYFIQWFARARHDDKNIKTFELTTNLTTTTLLEQHLLDTNISIGTTIRCAVSVASGTNGTMTKPTFSDGFFAGIKVLTPTLTIHGGQSDTLRLQQTIPLGCVDDGSNICLTKISLYNVNQIYQCPKSAVAVKDASHCGREIRGFTFQQCRNGCPRFAPQYINMAITTKQDVTYGMRSIFEILLKTEEIGVSHKIWKNYQIAHAHVNIAHDTTWNRKSCECTADPQMHTFDGRIYSPFYREAMGEFLLYENTNTGIQVHYKTYRCAGMSGMCSCGVAIRAGGDLWMYTTCNTADYIGFVSCKDGVLIEEKVGQSVYQIYTPSGTYIKVHMNTWSQFLDISVYPSPADVNHTRGHCGTLNGNSNDEFTLRDGSIQYENYYVYPHQFYESWRLRDDETYFDRRNQNPPSWNLAQQSCVCTARKGTIPEVHCSADQTAVCVTTNAQPVCNSRRKRSVYRHQKDTERVFKKLRMPNITDGRHRRSTVNVSFNEAYKTCLEFFKNQTIYNLRNSVPDAKLNDSLHSCANDAMIDIRQSSWIMSHFESWAGGIENELKRDVAFQETHAANVAQFKNMRCVDDCNGNGKCVKGSCQCNEGFSGSTCFINKADTLEITDIEGGGECDVREDDQCHECLQVKARYLLQDFKCNITVEEVDSEGQSRQTEHLQKNGEYSNVFEGHCCPKLESGRHRRSVATPGSFITKYLISVSNDGIHYGPSRNVYVFDSTCQEYMVLPNGDMMFSLKQDTCFIDGMCHLKGSTAMLSPCDTCSPDSSKYTWTQGCNIDNTNKEGTNDGISGNHVTIIVALSVTGIVVLGLAVLLIIWKLKRPTRPEVGIQKDEPPTYVNMPSNKKFESLSFQTTQMPPLDYTKY